MNEKQQKSTLTDLLQLGAISTVVIAIVMSLNSKLDVKEESSPDTVKNVADTTVVDTLRTAQYIKSR